MRTAKQPSLVWCLILDAIGMLTFSIPVAGELADVFWAPISGILFYAMFGSWKGAFASFFEEILPVADVIPTFTIMWLLNYFSAKDDAIHKAKQTIKSNL